VLAKTARYACNSHILLELRLYEVLVERFDMGESATRNNFPGAPGPISAASYPGNLLFSLGRQALSCAVGLDHRLLDMGLILYCTYHIFGKASLSPPSGLAGRESFIRLITVIPLTRNVSKTLLP
jgi:hypothetical protein